MSSKDFLGRGLAFPLRVDRRTGKIAMVSHEDDIREAVDIIINTYRGERVMRPDFGCTVDDYVFNPMAHSPAHTIAHEIRNALVLQEPRIENINVRADAGTAADASLTIYVNYTVRSTNNRYNLVYPFYRMEGAQL